MKLGEEIAQVLLLIAVCAAKARLVQRNAGLFVSVVLHKKFIKRLSKKIFFFFIIATMSFKNK